MVGTKKKNGTLDETVRLRIRARDRRVIDRAAADMGLTFSAFMRHAALEKAKERGIAA
jgi:uncharacterized protein (DUF1778 family)